MKNIIICSDGTWQSPESDTTTHVLRLAEGIAPQDSAGNKQVVFYDWGVGSEGDKFSGGITGQGLDKNIQDCYRFLVHNHARHAVAIDENRLDFEPTLWSAKAGIDLKQVWFAGVHTDIGGGYPNHTLGDIPGQWMAEEAEACGLALEPHLLLRMNPDYTGPKHNEYKGFYKVMRRKQVRQVEPVLHVSVKQRWDDEGVRYVSPGLKALVADVGWEKIQVVE